MNATHAALFKVLGAESRIKILDLLKENGPLCVSEMSETLGISHSAVSQHLKVLRHAGIVTSARKGYWIPYEVDPTALEECRKLLSKVCTCGCVETAPIPEEATSQPGDDLRSLRMRERRLQRELEEVQSQIQDAVAEGE